MVQPRFGLRVPRIPAEAALVAAQRDQRRKPFERAVGGLKRHQRIIPAIGRCDHNARRTEVDPQLHLLWLPHNAIHALQWCPMKKWLALAPLVCSAQHIDNLKQLTFGGQNAEAYWSPDGKRLIFQSTRDGAATVPTSIGISSADVHGPV